MTKDENSIDKKEESIGKKIRRDFFYGLFVLLPTIATISLVTIFINLISGPINNLFNQKIPPIASFIITISLITVIGLIARNFIGAAILRFVENLFIRVPIINTIYKSIKQIVNAFSFKNKNLLGAVLVEYPKKGTWALAFLTKENASGLYTKDNENITEGKCALFVPTTPNPTSGYLIYVNRSEIKELAMSIEDSIKVLMSAGFVSPEANLAENK
jgi:uncharacterized membrane protein